jgi:hypothetical protein
LRRQRNTFFALALPVGDDYIDSVQRGRTLNKKIKARAKTQRRKDYAKKILTSERLIFVVTPSGVFSDKTR